MRPHCESSKGGHAHDFQPPADVSTLRSLTCWIAP